jgi:Zn-dependent protease
MHATNIITLISVIILPLIFAITLHEAAHGFVAKKFGDTTAYALGRVTLNPAKHIDPFGTIILPILMLFFTNGSFLFGWAKPVPVNWSKLRNPRLDMALVAIAGPLANLVMALFWAGVAKLAVISPSSSSTLVTVTHFFQQAGVYGVMINCVLLVLNLIPIPPLDGSRIISAILPPNMAHKYELIEPYGIWVLLAILIMFGRYLLGPPIQYMMFLILRLFGLA